MIDNSNNTFDKVYDKLIVVAQSKIKNIVKLRQLGKSIDYKTIKLLNLYIRYLESTKASKYRYFTIAGLNNISNFLNTL